MPGVYATHVFPRLMDWVMRMRGFQELRTETLTTGAGAVLEIGFGTGLNLPHYPEAVRSVTGVDPADVLPQRVAGRIAAVPMPVSVIHTSAEALPFGPASFDCIVSTWTLCSIPNPIAALREARRVLKPEGRFLFLEHGRSEHPGVAAWQDRLNPLQQRLACGCNLNRRIDELMRAAGWTLDRLDRFCLPGTPRLIGELYRGLARPAIMS